MSRARIEVRPTAGAGIVARCFPPDRREAYAWEGATRAALRAVGWVSPPQALVFAAGRLLVPARVDAAMLKAMPGVMRGGITPDSPTEGPK